MIAVISTAALIVLYTRILHPHFHHFFSRRRRHYNPSSFSSPPHSHSHSSSNDFFLFSPYYGLDDLSISSLPLSFYLEPSRTTTTTPLKDQCAVCLLEFSKGDRLRSLPLCSHSFHVSCIDVWLRNHATCPLCRSGVFVPVRSLDDMVLPDRIVVEPEIATEISLLSLSPAPRRDFLLKRSYSFGFERSNADVSVSASVSPWRYRRGFWSRRWASPFGSGSGSARVFSSYRGGGSRVERGKRKGFFSMGTVVAGVGAVRLPGSSRMRCGDPEALISPERFGGRRR